MDTRIAQLIKYIKQYKFIALILAVGLVLMLLPETKQEPEVLQMPEQKTENQEQELESILSQIKGVGKVKVLLTVSEGEQTIYVFDEDTSDALDSDSSRREAVVITDESRAQRGLVSQVLPPVYLGAVIVCQGGDSPGVRLAVVEAVGAATGLTADKISVLKMK